MALSASTAGGAPATTHGAERTSEARISPPAPEPRRMLRSTPRSRASRRALGEILRSAGSAALAAAVKGAGVEVALWSDSAMVALSGGASLGGGVSPGLTIHATIWPTGTSVPSSTLTPARMPSGRLEFEDHLVGLYVEKRLACDHAIAFPLPPGHQLAGLLGHPERRHD